MIKKYFWQILLITLSFTNCLSAKPEVIAQRVLPDKTFDIPKVYYMDMHLSISDDKKVFIEIGDFLWLNDRWLRTDKYGWFLNGFSDGNKLYLVFKKEYKEGEQPQFSICPIGKDITLEDSITTDTEEFNWNVDPPYGKVISVPGDNNAYYLFGYKTPLNFSTIISGGHGIHYEKPALTEIRGNKFFKPENIPYGGKADESYHISEILTGKDTIHFLGLRTPERFGAGNYQDNPPTPEILHYTEYNTKNKKLVRSQDIYENTPRTVIKSKTDVFNYWYGNISADKRNEKIVLVFSWVELNHTGTPTVKNVKSDIYYSQCNGGKFSEPEYIGDGLSPLVRLDSSGNAHVIWINKKDMLVHRAKKGNQWEEPQVISFGEETHPFKTYRGSKMCAEFDKDNNLNVVFLSDGNLVLAKIKFD